MDIRNWLVSKNKKTVEPKKRRVEDDDDEDVIPESPDVQIINKKKKTSHHTHSSKDNNKPVKDKLKEVKPTNLFGNRPIKRTEPIVKKEIKKTETGIHSDEEFEKSLLEIDGLDQIESNDHKNLVDKQKAVDEHSINYDKKTSNGNPMLNDDKHLSKKSANDKQYPKTNGDHRSRDSSSLNESLPSNSKYTIPKKFHDIKKDLRDTNKRKFSEFIHGIDIDDPVNNKQSGGNSAPTKINGDTLKTENQTKTNGDTLKSENHDTKNCSAFEDYEESKNKKRRINKSLNESVLTDEERHERKIHSAKLYQSYLNRTGPKNLGAKEIPEGAPNCFKDFAFLLTGVLDSFERDEIVDTINKYGGGIKSSMSKKVTHLLAGEDAGPAKMSKAQELGVRIINEDDFLKLIKYSNKKSKTEDNKDDTKDKDHSRKSSRDKYNENNKRSKDKDHCRKSSRDKDNGKYSKDKGHSESSRNKDKVHKSDVKKEKFEHKEKHKRDETEIKKEKSEHRHSKNSSKDKLDAEERNHDKTNDIVDVVKIERNLKSDTESSTSIDRDESKSTTDIKSNVTSGIMWVEKYKPQNVKQIIGQSGDNSNVNKLVSWLTKWYVNRKAKLAKPSPWAKNDDGGYYKAALLSGPPGVGKTTTVALVCKQLGFDMVEFNASDTRNKTLIKEQIGELLTTTSLSAYAKGDTGKQAVTKKHVLVMDEVDGMAGNEDRGGLQELIGLIKTSSVPIICMCNDRNSQKMRSLVNYCYDLRFSRPRVEQIKAAMRSICCRENIKIPPDVLGQLIVSANQDVRQTLNLLSMWAIDPSTMDADRLSKDATVSKKDVKLGPWEAIRKVFSAKDHETMSINDKSDLFFYDYSLAPLFVQENYLQVQPHCPKHEVLQRVSQAADSIAFSDTIEKRIRSSQAWSLLPMQAMYSSVLPGSYLSGHMTGQIQFPGWLGKNSRANKMHRLCQEIHAHTRLSTTGSKSSIFLDYATHLRDAIITPLIKDRADGIDQSLRVLDSYNLMREDLDSLTELSVWPGQRNPTVLIDSKVKAAMTRTYNKKATALPYAPPAVKRARARDDEESLEDEDAMDPEEGDSDPENDGLIKLQKKKSQQSESSSSSDKPSTSKGKSKSKGSSGKGKKK